MVIHAVGQEIEKCLPLVGDINIKNHFAYQSTRRAAEVFNTVHMAIAEAYINGLEVPDVVLQLLYDTCMPIFFRYFPSLLVPYEWVPEETEQLAEGSQELMKIQYDLPQTMLNTMLGNGKLIYPKYSMGLWEKGALTLEQSQMDMIDDVIEKLDIKDGDNILDFGCGWGCVANYILSKFPNIKFTGVNLSHEQCEYIRQKMQEPDSYLNSSRFILYEGDLNNADFAMKFDKIISIGVFCHVGNLTKAFQKLASLLQNDGKVFIHIITVRAPNNISSVYTHKYIFPHGRYWSYDAVPNHNKHIKTIQRWYLNGSNYSKTFSNWLQNFDNNQALVKKLNYGIEYAKFRRIWRFYLIWFICNFASCNGEYNGNGQYLMVHA